MELARRAWVFAIWGSWQSGKEFAQEIEPFMVSSFVYAPVFPVGLLQMYKLSLLNCLSSFCCFCVAAVPSAVGAMQAVRPTKPQAPGFLCALHHAIRPYFTPCAVAASLSCSLGHHTASSGQGSPVIMVEQRLGPDNCLVPEKPNGGLVRT